MEGADPRHRGEARQRTDHRRHRAQRERQGGVRRDRESRRRKDGTEARYQIVGEDEADIKVGLLSIGSPIARALIGKREGDEVEVTTPSGRRAYEIALVEYI